MSAIRITALALLGTSLFLGACSQDPPLSPEIEALAKEYTAAWNSGDPAAVAALYAVDGALTINGGEPARGRDAVEAVAASFMAAFPDLELSNDRLVEEDGRINYHWTFEGTNTGPPGTGNAVEFSGYESWVLSDDGLVQDSIGTFDGDDYERQLYAQPEALVELGATVFPRDYSLLRAEDGLAMPDGSLLVVDLEHGLRKVAANGSSEPFGRMREAGYGDTSTGHHFAANGISLEPGGRHALVADIHGGGIYRVAFANGAVEKVYQHSYGVNSAVRDSSGAIWFTQSAENPPENGEAGMWAAIDRPLTQGALLRLPPQRDAKAEVVVDGLQFANGLALDQEAGHLYLAETVGGRVLRYTMDKATGAVSDETVLVDNIFPDNIELDGRGNLWIANPLPNNVLILDTRSGASRWLFEDAPTRDRLIAAWQDRAEAGESRMDLLTPEAWAPMPGFLTGIIFAGERVYLSGLSNTLVAINLFEAMP